jgi:hypothetical protein
MQKRMKAMLFASTVAVLSAPVLAAGDADRVEALEHRIEALEARIAALEAHRTFTSFMPNFAERFHVMHRAGEAGDWAVASHELAEMKRITALSPTIDAEKGKLMQAMMAPSFEALEGAIEHANHEKFETALAQTIDTCNACHTATGSDFVQVTLDATESLSMRHPHTFMSRGVPSGHAHGSPSGMGEMMQGGMMQPQGAAKEPHDDTGKPAHND